MDASAQPVAGTLVDGRYLLVGLLGEGAFGGVWRARDNRLSGRAVAVKFLKVEFLEHPETVARFDAEADALAQVAHPNVVGVIDRGAWAGQRFIVTEFVEGRPLTAWIDDHRAAGTLPDPSIAAGLFDQVCAGIEAAHAVRSPGAIIHRDIKPDNVLVRTLTNGEQVVKVVDFGIAQLGRRTGTQTGMLMGTPNYMAPEQAFGHATGIGPWTDVFALCVLFTEMLTLRAQPAESEPWWGTVLRRPHEVRATLGALRPDIPPAIWDVVSLGLRPDGSERFQDAGALRRALRPLVQSLPHPPAALHGPFSRPSPTPAPAPSPVPPSPLARVPSLAAPAFAAPAFAAPTGLPSGPWSEPTMAAPSSRPFPASGYAPPPAPAGYGPFAPTGALRPGPFPNTMAVTETPARGTRWGLWLGAVTLVAVLFAGVIVVALVAYDNGQASDRGSPGGGHGTARSAPSAAPPGTASSPGTVATPRGDPVPTLTPSPPEGPMPTGMGPEGALDDFLARWYRAARRDPGSDPVEGFYAPGVRWHGSDGALSPVEVHARMDENSAAGGWLAIDWPRSEWEAESPTDDDVADTCNPPGARGDVVKIRAWATELRPRRPAAIGCQRLEGRYLLRVRWIGDGYRICHETWSLADGLCASCPTARACQH